MDSTMFFGNTCQNGLMPTLVRPPLPTVQPSLTVKQFLPFPLDTASTMSLFPGFNAMDPVQKAVLHHTLGLHPSTKRKHVSCTICQLRFNSQTQALAHYKGTKHAKKLKTLDSPKTKLKGTVVTKETANLETSIKSVTRSPLPNGMHKRDAPPVSGPSCLTPVSVPPDSEPTLAPKPTSEPRANPEADPEAEMETEEKKARRLLYCSLCKVAVNSTSQLDAHNSGTKHKTMLEARSGVGSIKSFPRPGVKSKLAPALVSTTGLQNKTFFCEICDVHVNSETQLKQHISSRRHKDRAAGKPAKPKYSPYSKPQKGQPKQMEDGLVSFSQQFPSSAILRADQSQAVYLQQGADCWPRHTQIKLSLGKELQSISQQILPSHLAAVAAAAVAMGNAFPHRSSPMSNPSPSPALFQTQPLPASLLRPAPGPVRTPHPQVLFTPY